MLFRNVKFLKTGSMFLTLFTCAITTNYTNSITHISPSSSSITASTTTSLPQSMSLSLNTNDLQISNNYTNNQTLSQLGKSLLLVHSQTSENQYDFNQSSAKVSTNDVTTEDSLEGETITTPSPSNSQSSTPPETQSVTTNKLLNNPDDHVEISSIDEHVPTTTTNTELLPNQTEHSDLKDLSKNDDSIKTSSSRSGKSHIVDNVDEDKDLSYHNRENKKKIKKMTNSEDLVAAVAGRSKDENEDKDKDKEYEDVEDENEEEDEEDESEIAENICTAEYFIDRIVPEDYPEPIDKTVKHINETIERINRLYRFSGKILHNFNPLIREMGSRVMDFLYEAQIDPQCLGSFVRIIRGIQQRRPWAVSFVDSTGSVVTGGFQEGRFVSFGEFEQCIAIQSERDDEMIAGQPIRGQYCMVKPVIPLPESIVRGEKFVKPEIEVMNRVLSDQYIETYLGLFRYMKNTILKLGLCLPSNCKAQEIENALNKFFIRKSGLSIQIGPHCVTANDPVEIDSYQVSSIIIFLLIGVLIIASTIYELIYRLMINVEIEHGDCLQELPLTQNSSKRICTPTSFSEPKSLFSTIRFQRQASTLSSPYTEKPLKLQILTTFSLIRNTRVLFDTPPSCRKTSIDTIRLLLILFFFVSNAYIYTIIFAPMLLKRFYVIGPLQLLNDKKYFFIRMYYMIHCFVTISGMTLVLNYRKKRFQYFQFIFLTYLRYAVPILFTIGLIYIIPFLNSGPMWSQFNDTITDSCRKSFWPTIFFYNNFNYNAETICNFPTVFVSLIFQLKVFAMLIIVPLSRLSTKKIFISITILLIASMIMNLMIRFYFKILIPQEYAQMNTFSEIKHSVMFFNFNPLAYLPTMIFGIGAGYLLKHQIKFRHLNVLTFGLVSFLIFVMGVIYMESMDLQQKFVPIHALITIISWGRLPMLAFLSWIIYAAEEKHIVMTRRFLGSVVWYPLCQLSYGFYISSLIVNGYRLFSIEENITLAPREMFRAIVSDAVIAFLFSYIIHICVTQPMKNIHYILVRSRSLLCSSFNIDNNLAYESSAKMTSFSKQKQLRFCAANEDISDISHKTASNNNINNNNNHVYHISYTEDCHL